MDDPSRLAALLDVAEQLGVIIRRAPAVMETSEHPGGAWVRLHGKDMLFLNPAAPVVDQINVVSGVLRGRVELAEKFLPPELRDLLDIPSDDKAGK